MIKRPAVIIDVDGTLSDHTWRLPRIKPDQGPAGYDEYHSLAPFDQPMNLEILQAVPSSQRIILTRQPEKWRAARETWLAVKQIAYRELIMAPNDDPRSPADFKRSALAQIMQRYKVAGAYDDDPEVCDMFASVGVVSVMVM